MEDLAYVKYLDLLVSLGTISATFSIYLFLYHLIIGLGLLSSILYLSSNIATELISVGVAIIRC